MSLWAEFCGLGERLLYILVTLAAEGASCSVFLTLPEKGKPSSDSGALAGEPRGFLEATEGLLMLSVGPLCSAVSFLGLAPTVPNLSGSGCFPTGPLPLPCLLTPTVFLCQPDQIPVPQSQTSRSHSLVSQTPPQIQHFQSCPACLLPVTAAVATPPLDVSACTHVGFQLLHTPWGLHGPLRIGAQLHEEAMRLSRPSCAPQLVGCVLVLSGIFGPPSVSFPWACAVIPIATTYFLTSNSVPSCSRHSVLFLKPCPGVSPRLTLVDPVGQSHGWPVSPFSG